MCEIFISADPALYERRSHSLRLHAAVTSICLENMFWQVLEEIAARDGLSLNQLLTRLHDEISDARGKVENFASFLRVCCLRYQSLQLSGSIPRDPRLPLRELSPPRSTSEHPCPPAGAASTTHAGTPLKRIPDVTEPHSPPSVRSALRLPGLCPPDGTG